MAYFFKEIKEFKEFNKVKTKQVHYCLLLLNLLIKLAIRFKIAVGTIKSFFFHLQQKQSFLNIQPIKNAFKFLRSKKMKANLRVFGKSCRGLERKKAPFCKKFFSSFPQSPSTYLQIFKSVWILSIFSLRGTAPSLVMT